MQMMHDLIMQKEILFYFFEGLIKVYCKHYRGTWFHLKNVKILQSVPFSKGKNETKEEALKPPFFLYIFGFLGVLSYNVRSFDV